MDALNFADENRAAMLKATALAYAVVGFKPFSLAAASKKPLPGSKGFHDATSDPAAIARLFTNHRGNIGVTFDETMFALDLDKKHGAVEVFDAICDQHGGFPATLTQTTPSGGRHLIFKKPPDVFIKNAANTIAPGIDTRTCDGYIAAEPSIFEGNQYSWLDWEPQSGEIPEIADCPAWLLKLLTEPKSEPKSEKKGNDDKVHAGNRNAKLTSMAGAMRRHGATVETIYAALLTHNKDHCEPPLPDSEVRIIAKSISRYDPETPDDDEENLFDLDKFALNGQSEKLEQQLLDDIFILGKIALLGQITVIYAKPNSGKTLLMLWLLIKAIILGELKAKDVYFINADDTFKGSVQKLKLAEEHGFKMLVPSHNGFNAEMLGGILKELCLKDAARGKVIILDTAKKFMDLMSKSKGTEFMKIIREFVSHGGSVIMLAHTNKHRSDDGGLIYAGTADVVDDADCAYTIDVIRENHEGLRTVQFQNFKARGDNTLKASYAYLFEEGKSYLERLESVHQIGDEEVSVAEQKTSMEHRHDENFEAIRAIEAAIEAGHVTKTELIKSAMQESCLSKSKIVKALKEHEGDDFTKFEYWHIVKGANNSMVYQLNINI